MLNCLVMPWEIKIRLLPMAHCNSVWLLDFVRKGISRPLILCGEILMVFPKWKTPFGKKRACTAMLDTQLIWFRNGPI